MAISGMDVIASYNNAVKTIADAAEKQIDDYCKQYPRREYLFEFTLVGAEESRAIKIRESSEEGVQPSPPVSLTALDVPITPPILDGVTWELVVRYRTAGGWRATNDETDNPSLLLQIDVYSDADF